MSKRHNRQRLIFLLLSFLLIPVSPLAVFASSPSKMFVFKKLAVPDIDDRTGKAFGEKIGKTVRAELEQMLRFDIIPPENVRVQYPLSPQALGKMNKKLQADGFIIGHATLSKNTVTISLEIVDGKGEPFALELLAMKEQASQTDLEKSVRELVVKLIHRIPYKAVITRVDDGVVTIDAGRVHGVEIGSKASLFEIAGVKRHPFTNEVIFFNREDLGEIQITQVEGRSARGKVVRIKKRAKIDVHQMVDFIPSERVIRESLVEKKELLAKKQPAPELRKTEKRRSTEETPKRPRGSLTASTGFTQNDYKFSSNQLNFKRNTSPVPIVAVMGEYWFLSSLGVDASYATSWVRFDQTGSIPETDASSSRLAAHLKYRHFFSNDPLSPEIVGSAGYRVYDFRVDQSDSIFYNNIKYSGIDIALAASYPVTSRIKGTLDFSYQPSLVVEEDPVTSGADPKAYGYSVGLTGRFKIFDGMTLALGYHYQAHETKFSGTGTRNAPAGTTDASIHDVYHEAQLSLVYEF